MYWPIIDLSVSIILLDPKNIRLPNIQNSQDAILQDLFSNEHAFDIVKSIAQHGIFPDEFPVVVKENDQYVVIEGNRRIAALQALLKPTRVPLFEDRISSIKNSNIKNIKVVLAPSRQEAGDLIANKHTIVLRRPWPPLRQAYFYKSQLDNNKTIQELITLYPEHDIPKFIKMLELHHLAKSIDYESDYTTGIVHDERHFPITTVIRLFQNQDVKTFFCIDFNNEGRAAISCGKSDFKKLYKKLMEDISEGIIDSRSINNKEQVEQYINSLKKSYSIEKKKAKLQSLSFKDNKIDIKDKRYAQRSFKRNNRGLIPPNIPFRLNNSALREIYRELREIPVKDYANATHDLLRSFLECTLVFYLKETKEFDKIAKNSKHNPKLDELLTFVMSQNCLSIKDPSIKQIVEHIKQDYTAPYSLTRHNMIHHNENWITTEKDVRVAWAKMESLMKHIMNPNAN